jgi:hypothetical protein
MIMYAIADNDGPINDRTFTTPALAGQVLNDTSITRRSTPGASG